MARSRKNSKNYNPEYRRQQKVAHETAIFERKRSLPRLYGEDEQIPEAMKIRHEFLRLATILRYAVHVQLRKRYGKWMNELMQNSQTRFWLNLKDLPVKEQWNSYTQKLTAAAKVPKPVMDLPKSLPLPYNWRKAYSKSYFSPGWAD